MEITNSIQIFFNFPKIYRVDNDDLEYGSILKPGSYNITVTPNVATTFYCTLANGHQIKTLFYNDSPISYTVLGDSVISFNLIPDENGLTGKIEAIAESGPNSYEVYDLNNLTLTEGPNNITAKFRNHAYLDSGASQTLTYNYITNLQGTTWLLNEEILPGPYGLYGLTYITEDEEEYKYLRFGKVPMTEVYTPKHSDVLYYYKSTDDNTDLDITHNSCVYYPGRNPKWSSNPKRTILITGGENIYNRDLISWLQVSATRLGNYLYNDRSSQSNNLITHICSRLSIQPSEISSITFASRPSRSYDAEFSVGASDSEGRILNENSDLRAYCKLNNQNKYDIVISNGTSIIRAPQKMDYMFYNGSHITDITMSIVDTSHTTSMEHTFELCSTLLNLTQNFNTNLVTSFRSMFYGCSSIGNFNVNNFTTPKLTDTSYMFYGCSSLSILNMNYIDTHLVTDMSYMFYGCTHLFYSNLESLDFSSVTTTSHMCDGSGVSSITVRWNAPNLLDMSYMFANCVYLSSFNIPSSGTTFRANAVTNMSSLFEGCTYFTTLNLSRLNTTNVQNFSRMFYGCTKINRLDISSFIIDAQDEVTDMLNLGSNLARGETRITLPVTINKTITVSAGSMKWYDEQDNLIINGEVNNNYESQIIKGLYRQILVTRFSQYLRTRLNSSNITTLMFLDNIPSGTYDQVFPVGVSSSVSPGADTPDIDSDLKAYCKQVGPSNENWAVYIYGGKDNTIDLPQNCNGMFAFLEFITLLDLSKIRTSFATSMIGMFSGVKRITSLNVSRFNTSNVTTMLEMFEGCELLNSLNISNFDTLNVTGSGMLGVFDGCQSLTSLTLPSIFVTNNITSTRYMFNNCRSLTSLNVSSFDTSSVTNMGCMFKNCETLTSLYLANFNTSNVTTMEEIFEYCYNLRSIVWSINFDTSNVTTMKQMFYECRSLTSLDVSNFNTSKVTNMRYLFCGCKNITSLDVSNFDTSEVTNMDGMFYLCQSLTSLDVSGFNTSNVTNMNCLFCNCESLTSLNISSFDTSNVINMGYMFGYCENIHSLSLPFNTSSVTDMRYMFSYCKGLVYLDISSFQITQNADVSHMLEIGGSSISEARRICLPYIINLGSGQTLQVISDDNWYDAYDNLIADGIITSSLQGQIITTRAHQTLTVTSSDPAAGTVSGGGSYYPGTLVTLTATANTGYRFSNWTSGGVVISTSSTFNYTMPNTNATVIGNFESSDGYLRNDWSIDNITRADIISLRITNNSQYLAGLTERTGQFGTDIQCFADGHNVVFYNPNIIYAPVNSSDLFAGLNNCTHIYFDNFNTSLTNNMENMFRGDSLLISLDLSDFDTSHVTTMCAMFEYCHNLTSIYNFNLLDTGLVTDMSYMFGACKSLNISTLNIDTSSVINMSHMFYGCEAINNLTFSQNFITSNVSDMSFMFWGCSNLQSLDVPTFNTSSVTNMENMFAGDRLLTNLDVSRFNTSNVVNMGHMFYGCQSLSTLNVTNFNTSKVTIMAGMFRECGINNIDISNFNTANVTDMSFMFAGAINLTQLDLSSFNTSKVTTMAGMFNGWAGLAILNGWSALTNLNISSFNTSNVIHMDNMFGGLQHINSLNLSHFNTSKVISMRLMFDFSNFTSLNISSFDFSRVTDMYRMFALNHNLANIIWPQNINTPALTNIGLMFARCNSLTTIDLSDWNLSNITDASGSFYQCSALSSLLLPNSVWGNSLTAISGRPNDYYISNRNVGIFDSCPLLTSLDLSNMRTPYITDFSYIFKECTGLISINMSGLTIPVSSTVTDMLNLGINNNRGDIVIDLPQYINTSFVVSADNKTWYSEDGSIVANGIVGSSLQGTQISTTQPTQFSMGWQNGISSVITPSSITSIKFTTDPNDLIGYTLTNCNCGSNIETYINGTNIIFFANEKIKFPRNCDSLFGIAPLGSSNLVSLIFNHNSIDTSFVSNMRWMFGYNKQLTRLDLSEFVTTNVTDMSCMFGICDNLQFIDLSSFNTLNVTNMHSMFNYCPGLNGTVGINGTSIVLSADFQVSNVQNLSEVFRLCRYITSIDISWFNTSQVTNTEGMFEGCNSLTTIYVGSGWNVSSVTSSVRMFSSCTNLVGQQGTIYDSNYTDKTYAKVDGGPSSPGYLSTLSI